MACTLALWWLKFGPTEGGGGGRVVGGGCCWGGCDLIKKQTNAVGGGGLRATHYYIQTSRGCGGMRTKSFLNMLSSCFPWLYIAFGVLRKRIAEIQN